MATRTKPVGLGDIEVEALKVELRQAGVASRGVADARNAAVREEWAAKMAAEPARRPIHTSVLRPTGSAS